MSVVRTHKGRVLDMGKLADENAHMRAIGNANMNARGDRLDAFGKVVKTAEQIDAEREAYNRENPNAVRQMPISALDVEVFASPSDVFKAEPELIQAKARTKKIISTEE